MPFGILECNKLEVVPGTGEYIQLYDTSPLWKFAYYVLQPP